MKKLLLSTAIVSFTLFAQAGASADIAASASMPAAMVPASAVAAASAATQVAVAATDLRLRPVGTQPVSAQLVAIGDNLIERSAGRQAADGRNDRASTEGLPSTPVALASLLLVLCILIGRRGA